MFMIAVILHYSQWDISNPKRSIKMYALRLLFTLFCRVFKCNSKNPHWDINGELFKTNSFRNALTQWVWDFAMKVSPLTLRTNLFVCKITTYKHIWGNTVGIGWHYSAGSYIPSITVFLPLLLYASCYSLRNDRIIKKPSLIPS